MVFFREGVSIFPFCWEALDVGEVDKVGAANNLDECASASVGYLEVDGGGNVQELGFEHVDQDLRKVRVNIKTLLQIVLTIRLVENCLYFGW